MNQARNRQIFFSESGRRWQVFLGILRIFAVVICFAATIVVISFEQMSSRKMPVLESFNKIHNDLLTPEHSGIFPTQATKEYKNLREKLSAQASRSETSTSPRASLPVKPKVPDIRAVYYVNGDPSALYSLQQNIAHVNYVVQECFAAGGPADTARCFTDTTALTIMRQHQVHILSLLSNYINDNFDTASTTRMLASKASRGVFIAGILRGLKKMQVAGITVDFENLPDAAQSNYASFIGELYTALHHDGFIVWNEIPVEFENSFVEKTASATDMFILTAYDLHFQGSDPGPITGPRWVKQALTAIGKRIPVNKVILGVPAYGYDWKEKRPGNEVKYEEAVSLASVTGTKVKFDSTYNCFFHYADDTKALHQVWFTDAVTCYNFIHIADDFSCAGILLNKLGGEDQRIWSFFDRDIRCQSLHQNVSDMTALSTIPNSRQVNFEGDGEVLNPVSEPDSGRAVLENDPANCLVVKETYTKHPSSYLIKRFGKTQKKIVLSFDDGPSKEYTPGILDILRDKHVPAVFFIVGVNGENNFSILRRIYREGHEIGNHSFTHPNLAIVGPERAKLELRATRRIIECVTGHTTLLFRPPYNSDYEPRTLDELVPVIDARKESYYTISDLIDPHDWEPGISVDSILARVKTQKNDGNIVLLHDAGGDRNATVRALPAIIDFFRSQGDTFVSVAELMGKSRNEVMPPLAGTRDRIINAINRTTAVTIYSIERIVLALFFISIFLTVGRTVAIAALAAIHKRRAERCPVQPRSDFPLVSIIVPAHNEEVTAVDTIKRLLQSDYPALEIIFVDDGSKDTTYATVCGAFPDNRKVRIFTKENGGKATALNYGIRKATGNYLVCIDADTQLKFDAISRLMEYFTDDIVAAVAGNVKVGNECNLLTKWQSIEYITSQNFDRRAFDLLNAITVVPGAIGAFRKSAVVQIGMLRNDTLAEDCDLTVRLLRADYRVRYCNSAIAMTEAPESLKMFLKQRFRWSFGILQSMWKHRDTMLMPDFKNLGLIALPNALLFQFIMPLLAPLADLYMLFSIIVGNWRLVIWYYVLFTIVDIAASMVAFSFEKEKMGRLWLLIPHRISYRILMYYVLIKSILTAINGRLVGWGILKRTGRVGATT